MGKIYTTRSGADILGIKQDTLKHYAIKFDVGFQPGGFGTPHLFTFDDLMVIRERQIKHEYTEIEEDRIELELGPLYESDARPRK